MNAGFVAAQPAFPKFAHATIVAHEDNQCVALNAKGFQMREQAADILIHPLNQCVNARLADRHIFCEIFGEQFITLGLAVM